MIDAGPLHHEPASVRPPADETQVYREGAAMGGLGGGYSDPDRKDPEPNLGLLLLLFCWRGGVWEASAAGGG